MPGRRLAGEDPAAPRRVRHVNRALVRPGALRSAQARAGPAPVPATPRQTSMPARPGSLDGRTSSATPAGSPPAPAATPSPSHHDGRNDATPAPPGSATSSDSPPPPAPSPPAGTTPDRPDNRQNSSISLIKSTLRVPHRADTATARRETLLLVPGTHTVQNHRS